MHFRILSSFLAPCVAAALALVFWAEPAAAQGRGMMPMQPSSPMMTMPGGMPMMRPQMSMPNSQAVFLVAALRQREAFLLTAQRQVEVEMAALKMRPATATRNAMLIAAQQRQMALTTALRQVALQIAAVQG
jgi:hypothetical protein